MDRQLYVEMQSMVQERLRDQLEHQTREAMQLQSGIAPPFWQNPMTTASTGTATAIEAQMSYDRMRYTYGEQQMRYDESLSKRLITITVQDGRRTLEIVKKVFDKVEITDEDIKEARARWWKTSRITIINRKAEKKSEDLLKMFVSEVDFRNYKEKGYFLVRSGKRLFRIWKDNHKHIDMWEKDSGIFIPKSRLCVHTPTREVPLADEVVSKLMLIRSGSVIQRSNHHSVDNRMERIKEKELILVN